MDKKINKIEMEVAKGKNKEAVKDIKVLKKMDKKQDKIVKKAKKMKK